MIYDAETVHQAMTRAGRLAQNDLAAALTGFDNLGLSRQERLAAIASAIAASHRKRHAADGADFLRALRELTRPAMGYFGALGDGELFLSRVSEALRLIVRGLDRLVARLEEVGLSAESAALVETVMLARLLAVHRPQQITLAIAAAERAAARPDYTPGDIVPLGSIARPSLPVTALVAAG
jgi:hypothetical protein